MTFLFTHLTLAEHRDLKNEIRKEKMCAHSESCRDFIPKLHPPDTSTLWLRNMTTGCL